MILVDTDVLVDCLRGTVPAKEWLAGVSTEDLAVPGVVAMELLIGCRHQAHLQEVQKFLNAFSVAWPDASDSARAYELLSTHRLGSGLGIPDCLIAAMALNRNAPLYTFNAKHFRVITGLDVRQPYTRS